MIYLRTIAWLILFLAGSACSRTHKVATFRLQGGFVCEVLRSQDYEVNVPYYGRVTQGSVEVMPLTYIAGYLPDESPAFELLSSNDRRVVGIVARHQPNKVLMLFDAGTHASWPRAGDSELPSDRDRRGAQLLSALARSPGGRALVLSSQ